MIEPSRDIHANQRHVLPWRAVMVWHPETEASPANLPLPVNPVRIPRNSYEQRVRSRWIPVAQTSRKHISIEYILNLLQ
jgi:hypothetical protein